MTLLLRAIEKSVSPGCTTVVLPGRVFAGDADMEPVVIDPVSRSRLGSSAQPIKNKHAPTRSTVASRTTVTGEEDVFATKRTPLPLVRAVDGAR